MLCFVLLVLHSSLTRVESSLHSPWANQDLEVLGFHKPVVLSLPGPIFTDFHLKISDESWYQLRHFQHRNVAADACAGAEAELRLVSTSAIQGKSLG